MWKRDGVFARDVRHFLARSIYIAIFLVVTVYYSTKNTILTASAQAAMREVFVEEEWDNPYQTKTFLDIRTLDEFWSWQDNVLQPAVYGSYDVASQQEAGLTYQENRRDGEPGRRFPIYNEMAVGAGGDADAFVSSNEMAAMAAGATTANTSLPSTPPIARFFRFIGRPRIRQIRTIADSCDVDTRFKHMFGQTCFSDQNPEYTDTVFHLGGRNITHNSKSDTYPYLGDIYWLPSTGYNVVLPENRTAGLEILSDMKKTNFVDLNTRALLVEFTLYNGNVDLFTQGTLVVEFATSGFIVASYRFTTLSLLQFSSRETSFGWTVLEFIFYVMVSFQILKLFGSACCCRPYMKDDQKELHRKYGTKCAYVACCRKPNPNHARRLQVRDAALLLILLCTYFIPPFCR